MRTQCPRNKEGRRITRWVQEAMLARMPKRVEIHAEVMKKRTQIVEHPFGTIKHWQDHGAFLMRGLEKVRAEFSVSALADNIRRVVTILGVPHLLRALA